MKKYSLIILLLLTSCECEQTATGVILDSETKQPVDKVGVSQRSKNDTIYYTRPKNTTWCYSDSTGRFRYRTLSGALFGCPALKLYFCKEGYDEIPLTFESQSESDTVYLKRKK